MDAAINRFICHLKRNGVRISPSESIDAMRRWRALPVDRDTARTVLRSTLVKDIHDIPVFDELFELFFRMPGNGHRPHTDTITTTTRAIKPPRSASSSIRMTGVFSTPMASTPTANPSPSGTISSPTR